MADNDGDTKRLHKASTAPLIPDDHAELARRYIERDQQLENALEAIAAFKEGHERSERLHENQIMQKANRILDLEAQLALSLEELELRMRPLDILLKFVNAYWRGGVFDKMTHEAKVKLFIREYESMKQENQLLRATRPHEVVKALTPPPTQPLRDVTPQPGSMKAYTPPGQLPRVDGERRREDAGEQ